MNSEAAGTEWIRKADALVTKWRGTAEALTNFRHHFQDIRDTAKAAGFKECADELAEVIARNVQPSPDENGLRRMGILVGIDMCIREISQGRTIVNFGHLSSVVRALEWVIMDLRNLEIPACPVQPAAASKPHCFKCEHDHFGECESRPVPQPATEPTIEESLRLIRKMEMCEGNAAKLVLLKNFVIRAALALRDVSQGQTKYWIVEWSFAGKNEWLPIRHAPFQSESSASGCPRRDGFDYRILALAARQVPVSSEKEK